MLIEFELSDKVISITTDNGSNMVAACRLLKNQFNIQTSTSEFVHFRCICHVLNLAIQAGINEEKYLIKKLRKLCKKVRKSQSFLENLERLAIASNKKFKKPIIDIKIRWNSIFCII